MTSDRIRYRIGIEGPWYAKNSTVFVLYFPSDKILTIRNAVNMLISGLKSAGYDNIASRIVFEQS